MSNLIITIISIALVAVAAIMGAFYGGTAFVQGQINATAAAILNTSQQMLTAERLWAVNNSAPDISSMPNPGSTGSGVTFYNSTVDTVSGIPMLISSGELSTWPAQAGSIATSPQHGQEIDGCYNIDGYQGRVYSSILTYNGGNYYVMRFYINIPAGCAGAGSGQWASSTTDVSQANHPIVLIAKSINKTLDQISSSADLSYMPYIGLPSVPTSGATTLQNLVTLDSNGVLQSNYCYLESVASKSIICAFGPS